MFSFLNRLFAKNHSPISKTRKKRPVPLAVLALEDRVVPAQFPVTSVQELYEAFYGRPAAGGLPAALGANNNNDPANEIDLQVGFAANTITLPAPVVGQAATGPITITNANAINVPNKTLIIKNQTNAPLTIQPSALFGMNLFNITNVRVTFGGDGPNDGITFTRAGGVGEGGAIKSNYPLILKNDKFIFNSATLGGAVYDTSLDSEIQGCTFESNLAETAGGALYVASAAITGSTFTSNNSLCGGAVYAFGNYDRNSFFNITADANRLASDRSIVRLAVTSSWFESNTGWGIPLLNQQGGIGGAIYCSNWAMSVERCTFISNSSNKGGAIYFHPNNENLRQVFNPVPNAVVSRLINTGFTNSALSLSISDCNFGVNTKPNAAAVAAGNQAVAWIPPEPVPNNTLVGEGGALYVDVNTDNLNWRLGPSFNGSVVNSTFYANSAQRVGGGVFLRISTADNCQANMAFQASTFNLNTTTNPQAGGGNSGGSGGAMYICVTNGIGPVSANGAGRVSLVSLTVAGNSAQGNLCRGGGIRVEPSRSIDSAVTAKNCIIANNLVPNSNEATSGDVWGRLISDGYNLIVKPLYGTTIVTGFAHICGYRVAILANAGILSLGERAQGRAFH